MTTAPLTARPVAHEHSTMTPAIAIEALSKRYPEQRSWRETLRYPLRRRWIQVLENVNLTIRTGEFFGLLGPNGAGKTTLFKILSTLIDADDGDVLVHGRRASADPAGVRRLVTPVIADERSLRWRLSARENLRLYAHLYGIARSAVAKRIDQLLDVVGLTDTGTRMVGTFSTGMKQRLALARALLAEPSVLLLDEPTRSLDPLSARSLRAFLRDEIGTRRGTTIMLATHIADEAFDLCDRVGVLHKGRLLACGSAQELARDFADQPYRLWTTMPDHPALHSLRPRKAEGGDELHGWHVVEIDVPSDDAAAETLRRLAAAGVPMARFEKANVMLADLIERVVSHRSAL